MSVFLPPSRPCCLSGSRCVGFRSLLSSPTGACFGGAGLGGCGPPAGFLCWPEFMRLCCWCLLHLWSVSLVSFCEIIKTCVRRSAGTVVPAPPGPAAVGFGGETTVGGVDRASASAARVLPFAPGPSYFGFSPITGISTEFELLSRKSLPIK